MTEKMEISITVNGTTHEAEVEPRTLLVDFLRREAGLTGTHRGCSSGQCGACTVVVDDQAEKSCMTFAVQADGSEIVTIEGVSDDDDLNPIQESFVENFAVQCGFCTPGMIMATNQLLDRHPDPTEEEIREAISGNLCRCTGYTNIVNAIQEVAGDITEDELVVGATESGAQG